MSTLAMLSLVEDSFKTGLAGLAVLKAAHEQGREVTAEELAAARGVDSDASDSLADAIAAAERTEKAA